MKQTTEYLKNFSEWRNERAKQRQKEAEDREAIAKFWEAYKREMQKLAEDSRPSNLNFGMF